MALPCGHRANPETKVAKVKAGICPGCDVALEPVEYIAPHGYCPCCGWRWLVKNGQVLNVVFT